MISEPELEGDLGPPDGLDALSDDEPAPKRPRREVPRWAWAVGGALLASVLWAGGLYVAGLDDGVDARGYQVGTGLCAKARMPALARSVKEKPGLPREVVSVHDVRDRVDCTSAMMPEAERNKDDFSVSYHVETVVELFRKTDPGPEFEAAASAPRWPGDVVTDVDNVAGLGERAYFLTADRTQEQSLMVLDGALVLTIQVGVSQNYTSGNEEDGPSADSGADPVDAASLRPLMVRDARDLMDALKR